MCIPSAMGCSVSLWVARRPFIFIHLHLGPSRFVRPSAKSLSPGLLLQTCLDVDGYRWTPTYYIHFLSDMTEQWMSLDSPVGMEWKVPM